MLAFIIIVPVLCLQGSKTLDIWLFYNGLFYQVTVLLESIDQKM